MRNGWVPRQQPGQAGRQAVTSRLVPVAAALVVVATVCAGCVAEGPASFGGGEGTQCSPVADGGRILFGDVLGAPQSEGLEVLRVTLDDPEGVRLIRAYLIPIYPSTGIYGIGSATVPPDVYIPGWDERVDAAGSELAASEIGGVVVEVERTSELPGTFAAIRVDYRVGRTTFSKPATTTYALRDRCF